MHWAPRADASHAGSWISLRTQRPGYRGPGFTLGNAEATVRVPQLSKGRGGAGPQQVVSRRVRGRGARGCRTHSALRAGQRRGTAGPLSGKQRKVGSPYDPEPADPRCRREEADGQWGAEPLLQLCSPPSRLPRTAPRAPGLLPVPDGEPRESLICRKTFSSDCVSGSRVRLRGGRSGLLPAPLPRALAG